MDEILRQIFIYLKQGEIVGYNGNSYMKVGNTLADLLTGEYLICGIDF